MIPLSNKFPNDHSHILLGVSIDMLIRGKITMSVRNPVFRQYDFRDDHLFEEIENYMDHLEYYWSSRNETTR